MALIDGVFWHPGDLLPFQEFLLGLARTNEETDSLINRKKETAITTVHRCLDAGAHGWPIGDDIAYARDCSFRLIV